MEISSHRWRQRKKIEGFFDICNLNGLTGEQGVIIPRTNIAHLMVNENVRLSVLEGRFHIWVADHVNHVMTLLTGIPMGKLNTKKNNTRPIASMQPLLPELNR